MFGILGWIVFGLVVGVIAKLLMPGRDPRRAHHHHGARDHRGGGRWLHRMIAGMDGDNQGAGISHVDPRCGGRAADLQADDGPGQDCLVPSQCLLRRCSSTFGEEALSSLPALMERVGT